MAMLHAAVYYFHFTRCVLAIFCSTRAGCPGIPVPPEDPPLGTLHRTNFPSFHSRELLPARARRALS